MVFIEVTSDFAKKKYLVNVDKIERIEPEENGSSIHFGEDYCNILESYEEIKKMIMK